MIYIFEQELPHYRVPVFAALKELLAQELIVYYGRPRAVDGHMTVSDDRLPFEHKELKMWWFAKGNIYAQNWAAAFRMFGRPDVVLVRHAIRNLTLFPLLWYCKYRRIPVVVWGQGYSRKRHFNPEGNLYDRIHLAIVRAADAYACYTPEIRDGLAKHVTETKLFVAMNTLDTRETLKIYYELIAEGKQAVKRRLGLERRYYLSFIGRLQVRKQPAYLLEVYEILKKTHALDVGLLIIGTGDQEAFLRRAVDERSLSDVLFLGARFGADAGQYLFASDVMVMPGLLGLAVNHAFMFGLPVVSQRFGDHLRGHALEAAYVQHEQTGWFAEVGDKAGMAKGILHILENWQTYSDHVSAYVDRYLCIERMLDGFADAIAHAKKKVREG